MDTKKLRQKILDLAIHGKLVPQDPNDEPASVLLERIRAEKERLIAEGKIKRSKKSCANREQSQACLNSAEMQPRLAEGKSATSDTPHYENVPFEVPEGWCWCTVEDVFELNPKNKVEDNVICGFIPMALVDDGFGYSHSFEERPWGEVKKGYCHFQNGDIGIAKISPCFENRKSTIFSGLPNGIGAGTTELSILRGSLVDCRYFLFLFQSEWYLREGTKYFKGVVGQQRVNKEIFTTLQIPLPPLAEQQRIANAIETCMFLCSEIDEYRDGVHSAIVASKSKILDLAIHGKLVPQDDNDEPASELLKRINPKAVSSCDNPHYENIPSSWVCTTMGSLFQHNTGKALNKSTSVEGTLLPYLTTSNVYWNTFDLSVVKEMRFKESEIEKCTIRKGDLLVCEGGDIGRSAIWDKDYSICIQNHLHRLRPKGDVIPLLYLYYIMYLKLTNNLEGKGIGLQGFSSGLLDKLEVPLPPYNEQIRIVDKIQDTFNMLDSIAESLN